MRCRRALLFDARGGEGHLSGPEAHLVDSIANDVLQHILCIPEAIDVADLIPVERRDRNLDDHFFGLEELKDEGPNGSQPYVEV